MRTVAFMALLVSLLASPVLADGGQGSGPVPDPPGTDQQGTPDAPCSIVTIGSDPPYVDPHPNCL